MNDKTVLNPSLQAPQPNDQTVLNTVAIQAEGLRPGMKLKNGMTILEKMDVASGEADLYLCEREGTKFVLKHYRQAQSLKKEVTETLKSIRSEYVARVFAVGIFLERNYEIDEYFPLEIFMRVKPIIILEGNVMDIFQYPIEGCVAKGTFLRLTEYLHYFFLDHGYRHVVIYDHLQGFHNPSEPTQTDRFAEMVQENAANHIVPAPFKGRGAKAAELTQRALRSNQESVSIVMDFASRYITASDRMDQSEVDAFTQLQQAGMEAKDIHTDKGMAKNLCVLLVNKLNDLPAWFYLQNPNCKTITVSTPSREERVAN